MGIYSMSNTANVVAVEAQAYPDSMSIMETALTAVIETESNWTTLMKAVGIQELAVLESTGEEIVYEAGTLRDFANTVKEFFVKIIKKVKGIFESFIAKINSYISDDKEFVKKYRKDVLMGAQNIPDTFTFKGYTFKGVAEFAGRLSTVYDSKVVDGDYKQIAYDATSADTKLNNKNREITNKSYKDGLELIRGKMIGDDKKYEASEFSKEFTDYLQGSDKETFDDRDIANNIGTYMAEIEAASETKKNAKKQLDVTVKAINNFIRNIDNIAKEYEREISDSSKSNGEKTRSSNAATYLRDMSSYYKEISQIYTTANGLFLSALKKRNRQYKAICVKVLSFKNRKPVNASYSYQSESGVYFQ